MKPFHEQFRTVEQYWTDEEWLGGRMLFLSGPRQVGKTTLVTSTICRRPEAYFNWDSRKVRRLYLTNPDFVAGIDAEWICFDEIHKRPKWKDILKGIYDEYKNRFRFVVTGSARLDMFRKSGDSLVGRYFHTHLFPLNLPDFGKNDFILPEKPESLITKAGDMSEDGTLKDLLRLSGFPEPFFAGSDTFWKRWSANHNDLIIREDLRDLSHIVEFDKIEHLMTMIGPTIGSTVSYRNIARELETTHASVRRWLDMLGRLQLVFSVSPYSKKISRAYKVEKKWYYIDWRAAAENVFENYVAASLLRATVLYTDRFGEKMSLHFVRTHDGTEIDFLICRGGRPWLLVEAKEGAPDVPSAAYRFAALFGIPCIIVTPRRGIFKKVPESKPAIYCISWSKFGKLLP